MIKRMLPAAVAALAMASVLFAQEFRGAISGAVLDPSGSLVAGAKIILTETNTSTKFETLSDSSGHYAFAFLLSGDYDISVRMEGFKEFVRKGVHLGAGERPAIDVRLEVGDSRQTVEVVADAPLINSENASVGQAITTKEVEDLPSNGGTPMWMVALAPGVVSTSQPTQVLPYASGGAASFSMAGMPNQQNELLTDGVPNTTWDGRLAYSPPKDAVQEVRVKVFDTDAAYGRTAGGTANTILRSGTNSVRGSLAWLNQPNNLVANNFFNNKSGLPAQVTHFNQGGLAAGGPVFLPKVFDGRNKVFWFFAFEDIQASVPNTVFLTVPTDAMRQGDFSKLLAVNGTAIYDPYTAVRPASTITRTAYPGNRIPASQMNPIALKYLGFFPKPNVTDPGVVRKDDYQNFGNSSTTRDGFTNELGRLDFNAGARSRTYFNVRHTDYSQTKNNYFSNVSTGSNLSRSNWGGSLDQVFTVNASNIVNLRLNYTRMFEDHAAPSAGFDPTQLGFPAYMAASSQYLQLPEIGFSGNSGIQNLGMHGANTLPSQSFQLFGSWSTVKGAHSIKTGADLRQYRLNIINYGYATGGFSFSGNSWVRQASNSSSTVALGQDFASFLLGLPYTSSGSTFDVNASAMFYSYYSGVFIQDDWRVRRNLTLNLGLRFDHDFPYHEKWGRSVNGFAFDMPSPLAPAAIAAYNARPVPFIPTGAFNVPGGLTFASPDDNRMFRNTSHLVSPRLGFAWMPDKLRGKTVIRGGIGMFVAPVTISQLGTSGSYSTNPLLSQHGFSQSTTVTATNDNYLTPATTLSNPFPTGIKKPVGSESGLLTFAGQNVTFLNPEIKSPYSVRWSLGLQHEFTPDLMLELLYIGSHSVHLPVSYTQLNGVPRQFLSTLPVRDQPAIDAITASTPNPFFGLQTNTATNTTVSTSQLLARFPQFPVFSSGGVNSASGVTEYNLSVGSSYYQGMNARLVKRFSKGLQVTLGFMRSRVIDRTTWLNDSDLQPEKRVSPFDRPMRLTMTMTYDLPIGRGRMLHTGPRWLNTIAGGWKVAGTYTFQTGAPLPWTNSDYVYYGGKLDLDNRKADGNAFDTSVFNTRSAEQFQYHVRTFSSTYMDLRQDGINDVNASLMKQFYFGDKRRYAQLRCDAFNAINHPTFAAPNTSNPTNTAFGQITAQANRPRMLQLGLRIVF